MVPALEGVPPRETVTGLRRELRAAIPINAFMIWFPLAVVAALDCMIPVISFPPHILCASDLRTPSRTGSPSIEPIVTPLIRSPFNGFVWLIGPYLRGI